MINAKELRIGNLVRIHTSIVPILGLRRLNSAYQKIYERIITQYKPTFPLFEYDLKDIDPIPLTPEILEACGFKTDNITHWKEYSIDGCVSYLSLTCGIYHWLYTNMLSEIDDYPRREIKYLHQLQNLYFAVTGNELEINEDQLTHILKNSVVKS